MQIIFTDGLGNQMFQYALYLAMRARGYNPKINAGFANRSQVHYGFEITEDFEISQLPVVFNSRFGGGVVTFFDRYLSWLTCYKEDMEKYSEEVFSTKKYFVIGYWQDERYFKHIDEEVRRAFTFRNIDELNLKLGKDMTQCNSVSLHIRRGDYLKYPQYQVCTPSYYKKSIELIIKRVEAPVFYIFSDDLEWSNNFIKEFGVNYKLVSINRGRDSYKDMYLMTQCRHNIIANSSFSWWGAWLGTYKDKIVIRPDEWIRNRKKNPCPNRWIRVNSQAWGGYYLSHHSWWQILCHEYENLKTGRKPVWIFALWAYWKSRNFRITVMMRTMYNKKTDRSRLFNKLLRKYAIEFGIFALIGDRLHIHHTVGIVIGTYAKIGDDCNIYQGVLLGQSNGIYPTIGNNVTLYPYCCVLGDVHVGNNVIVLAHSVVTHDIPDNCMVGGNPAKIIKYI